MALKSFKLNRNRPFLAIKWDAEELSVLLSNNGKPLQHEIIPISNLSEVKLVSKLAEYKRTHSFTKTLLVISRSEVFQKELIFKNNESISDTLSTKIATAIPYNLNEIAYSLVLNKKSSEDQSCRALLNAIPESKLNQMIQTLKDAGILVDEVVSEDQALCWLVVEAYPSGTAWVIDQTQNRIIFIIINSGCITYSKSYQPNKDIKYLISSKINEYDTPNPIKLYVSDNAQDIGQLLSMPITKLCEIKVCDLSLPFTEVGMSLWNDNNSISLLPNKSKLRKSNRLKASRIKKALKSMLLFSVCIIVLCTSHLYLLDQKIHGLEKDRLLLMPKVSTIKTEAAALQAIYQSKAYNQNILNLLQSLAINMPTSVQFIALQLDGRVISFKGESDSHNAMTKAVQQFEAASFLSNPNLEHARLRKRMGQEYFEFEVTAKWLG